MYAWQLFVAGLGVFGICILAAKAFHRHSARTRLKRIVVSVLKRKAPMSQRDIATYLKVERADAEQLIASLIADGVCHFDTDGLVSLVQRR